MRYEDWDILLFPEDRRVPMKEFKVACHVVHDAEFAHSHASFGLPTVCCFVPSLPAGSPFQVSMHSWSDPTVSQLTKSYNKNADSAKFEARLFVDGRLKASTCFDSSSLWPHVMAHSFEFSKSGGLQALRFPSFREELLRQSYWSPADDIGRIKIIISEGFPRESLSMPLERVKNIVAFSFQHAPLDILESSAIAWPNPSMWRRQPFTASMPVPAYPSEAADLHAHSPRRRADQHPDSFGDGRHTIQNMITSDAAFSKHGHSYGPQFQPGNKEFFVSVAGGGDRSAEGASSGFDWMSNTGPQTMSFSADTPHKFNNYRRFRQSSTDTSMPDYVPMSNRGSREDANADSLSGPGGMSLGIDEVAGASSMRAPSNTPTSGGAGESHSVQFHSSSHSNFVPPDLATSLTNSLLSQKPSLTGHHPTGYPPAPEVKSRKETRFQNQVEPSPSTMSSTSTFGHEMREGQQYSQQTHMPPTHATRPDGTMPSHAGSPRLMDSRKGLETGEQTSSVEGFGADGPGEAATEGSLRTISGNSAKASKRTRYFTPASTNAMGADHDSRRVSPSVRLDPFVDTGATVPLEQVP